MTDNTSTNTLALPCLQSYRVVALAMAYIALVDMTGDTAPADLPRAGTVTATRKRSQPHKVTD